MANLQKHRSHESLNMDSAANWQVQTEVTVTATGVAVNGGITSDSATDITVDGVDPRKAFRVGDTVYLHDVDAALGTIASMDSTSIILNAAIAGGTNLANNDELVNANPIKFKLGFER